MSKHPKIMLTLHMIRGEEKYNAMGELTSEHQKMKIQFDSLMFEQFKKNIQKLGFTKIKLIDIADVHETLDGDQLEEAKERALVELAKIYEVPEKKLTKEQLQIKRLEEKIAALEGKKTEKPAAKPQKEEKQPKEVEESNDDADVSEEDIEVLRERYFELYGKKPSHLMKEAGLKKKIAEAENK